MQNNKILNFRSQWKYHVFERNTDGFITEFYHTVVCISDYKRGMDW